MFALCKNGEPVVYAGPNHQRDHAEWIEWWTEYAPQHVWTVERVR